MSWRDHVAAWAKANQREFSRVEGILIRNGWNPESYRDSMEKDLFYWLDQWYTLSVKNLPQPATNYKKNPISNDVYLTITEPTASGYVTYKFNYITGQKEVVEYSETLKNALKAHEGDNNG